MTLVPDLRPQVPPPVPGSACCGCCEGLVAETPQRVANRGGLSAIAYRIGDHARFRASLLAGLASDLPAFTARDDADFTVGLLDAFACAADVLTFYQERLANETFLRTARERVSLQEIGKLVGYRLRPGLAAETWLVFSLDAPPVPPPGAAPGTFVSGVPEVLRLEAGLKVRSVPGPDEAPQVFETVEALPEARAGWNAVRPWLSEVRPPARGDTDAWLEGTATGLRPGDALLFVGDEFLADPTSDRWDFRLLASVEPDAEAQRTRVTWARGLGSDFPFSDPAARPSVHALRRRAGVFGHNAPSWFAMNAQFRKDYATALGVKPVPTLGWPFYAISPVAATGAGGAVDLDSILPGIAADVPGDPARRSFAVLAKGAFNQPDETAQSGTYVELYRVTGTSEVSRAAFAVSAKVTRLTLVGENLDTKFAGSVRETSVFAGTEPLPLAPRPVTMAVEGGFVPAAIAAEGLLKGRRLVVRGVDAAGRPVVHPSTLVAAQAVDAARCRLEIDPQLHTALRRDSVVVHANVALATHGETVTEVLGSGSGSRPSQRFELRQEPITHRAVEGETGARAELVLRVHDLAWTERPSLFGAGPTEHAFALRTDEGGHTFAAFGDGEHGARLPTGVNNVRATWRKGLGAAGNVRAETLTQLMSRPLGLKGATNPRAAEGGTDPEGPEAARERIPLGTRTLGRAVSLLDYEDFARAYAGIGKARVALLGLSTGPTLAVTVAAEGGRPMADASPIRARLFDALRAAGDPHVALALLPHAPATFRLGLRVRRDPAYEGSAVLAAVEAALRAAFSFENRALGQPVHQSEVIAVAQGVPGVLAVDLTALDLDPPPGSPATGPVQIRLLAARMRVQGGQPQPDGLLTLDPAPFALLEEMA